MIPNFLRKHPSIAASLFGICISLVLILCAEIVLRKLDITDPIKDLTYPPTYWDKESPIVTRPNTGIFYSKGIVLDTNEVFYDAEYTIDEYHRRVTIMDQSDKRDKFLLFIGGSYTYGEGLHDSETMASRVAAKTRQWKPYNYGFHGHGPYELLARLEHTSIKDEITETRGILIYPFIDDHLRRITCPMSQINWRYKFTYYKANKDGVLEFKGFFDKANPFLYRVYSLLSKSHILKALNIDFPPKMTEKHVELVARVILQSAETYAKDFPDNDFYFLIYPGSDRGRDVARHFAGTKVNVLDYTDLYDITQPEYRFHEVDLHPTARAIDELTDAIVKDLRLQ